MNSYDLSRNFWDWAFDNPEKISPNHSAIYFFAIEHCNRLGWKEKFGFPSQMTMEAVGIKKHSTYIRYFNDLVEWGFFKLIQKSRNQYSANIISLTSAMPKNGKAMGKAMMNHRDKHTAKQKEYNKTTKQLTTKQVIPTYDEFEKYALIKKPNLDKEVLRFKYDAWVESGWRAGKDLKPILNWKTTLLNTLQYLKETKNGNEKWIAN